LHGRRYALRVVFHSLETEVNCEVSSASQASEFLYVAILVSSQPIPLDLSLTVDASLNASYGFDNSGFNNLPNRLTKLNCPECQKKQRVNRPKLKVPKTDLSTTWYPKISFNYDGKHFLTRRRADTIEQLFTERNLYALALINDRISRIEDEKLKRTFQFVFASMVPQASKMMILTEKSGPSWKVPEYLIYPIHAEFNVWTRFANRFLAITRGLDDRLSVLPKELKSALDCTALSKADYLIARLNAVEISSIVPLESVDYVFTDPPYGGAIQYFELDMIRVAWILGKDKWADALSQWQTEEITINPGQKKEFDYYHKMLAASFTEVFKVLKPSHYLTVTFHSTDIDVWNSIIMAVRLAGFELEKILYQSPAVRSAKQSLQPWGSAVGDYYIRFRKPEEKKPITQEQVDRNKYRRIVVETTKKIIAERGEPTPFTYILNGIFPELDRQGGFLR
jgi:hypothetical protein